VLTAILHVLLQHFLRGEELHEGKRGGSQVAVSDGSYANHWPKTVFNNALDGTNEKMSAAQSSALIDDGAGEELVRITH
jgi:hypothetical protein